MRWVEPSLMGLWQTLLLCQSYGEVLRLGVVRGLNRELPFELGKGNTVRAHQLVATAEALTLIVSVCGLMIFLLLTLLPFGPCRQWQIAAAAAGVVWSSAHIRSYLEATFRGSTEFLALGKYQFLEAALQLITVILVAWWGFPGMCLRSAGVAVVGTVCLYSIRPIQVAPQIRWPDVRDLMATGLPLFGIAYLWTVGETANRVALLCFADITTLGLYCTIGAVSAVLLTIPNTFVSYFYPRITHDFAVTGNHEHVWRGSIRVLAWSASTSLLLLGCGWATLPYLLALAFPEYSAAAPAMRITLLASVFWSANFVRVGLYSMKAWRYLYSYCAMLLVAKMTLAYIFVQMSDPLTGVAIGDLVSGVVMALAITCMTFTATHVTRVSECAVPEEAAP